METSNIKGYAPKARLEFMDAVAKRLNTFGISVNKKGELQVTEAIIQGSVLQIGDNNFDSSLAQRRQRLVERSQQLGYAQLVEQVAYTWFNRLCSIRYMEIHGYLGHGFRVLSHPNGDKRFEILDQAQDAAEDLGLDRDRIIDLMLAGDKNEELYRELLLGQCHKLHEAMPFLFESLNDETELLLPDNLTRTDSILRGLVDSIPEEDWQQVEVIGWLYQFYISDKKNEVIGKVVKSEDIPAATQLFTPNWIVKYMVQNSLGAQWLATYPDSPLKVQMEYYIEPAEQTDEVNAQLKEITPTELNPEELTLIDPASGSGHILVEAYDLFKAIYLERGYRQRDIPKLTLENNLFGLDIDQRAAQLTGFALMMKGREDDRRLFERGVKLNVMAMVDSTSLDVDNLVHGIELSQYGLNEEDLIALKDLFEHATTFGSLIQVPQLLAEKLPALKQLSETSSQDMFVKEGLEYLTPLVRQAEILAAHYDAVVANPPYMGNKGMNSQLKEFAKKYYIAGKSDLFAMFIVRSLVSLKSSGLSSLVTMQSWMFLSSYEEFRKKILGENTIRVLTHLGPNSFPEITGPAIQLSCSVFKKGLILEYIPKFGRNVAGDTYDKSNQVKAKSNMHSLYSMKDFQTIPGGRLAYWIEKEVFDSFMSEKILEDVLSPRQGMATSDNKRFLRFWWEVSDKSLFRDAVNVSTALESGKKWFPYNKGGTPNRWFGNQEYVVNWEDDGRDLKAYASELYGSHTRTIKNISFYFKKGITWGDMTFKNKKGEETFAARINESGFIFDIMGPSGFPSEGNQLVILALLNSKVLKEYMSFMNPSSHFQVGDIRNIPYISDDKDKATLESLVKEAISISKRLYHREENTPLRQDPILLSCREKSVESSAIDEVSLSLQLIKKLASIEADINNIFYRVYGFKKSCENLTSDDVTYSESTLNDYAYKLISLSISCMMGRYSLDAPGLIYANSGNEGFDASQYTTFPADGDGIIPLTDAEWFADDAANRLVEFISMAWDKSHLEENLDFLVANLSPKKGEHSRDTIRRYLCDKFYKDHLQTYKKRPIYWLFSSGKQKAFQCLVYLHRYNESTLSRMRTEYVTPLLGKYQAYSEQLGKQLEMAESTQDKKRLERELKSMDKKQSELREFDDKLKHYADMRISIDLDDGVKENYGRFGDLLADVKNITGEKPEIINAS